MIVIFNQCFNDCRLSSELQKCSKNNNFISENGFFLPKLTSAAMFIVWSKKNLFLFFQTWSTAPSFPELDILSPRTTIQQIWLLYHSIELNEEVLLLCSFRFAFNLNSGYKFESFCTFLDLVTSFISFLCSTINWICCISNSISSEQLIGILHLPLQ